MLLRVGGVPYAETKKTDWDGQRIAVKFRYARFEKAWELALNRGVGNSQAKMLLFDINLLHTTSAHDTCFKSFIPKPKLRSHFRGIFFEHTNFCVSEVAQGKSNPTLFPVFFGSN